MNQTTYDSPLDFIADIAATESNASAEQSVVATASGQSDKGISQADDDCHFCIKVAAL